MVDDPNCECDLNIGCSGYLMEVPFDGDGADKVTDKGDHINVSMCDDPQCFHVC